MENVHIVATIPGRPKAVDQRMGGHHLILGQLEDCISGEVLDDTLDERYRQKIGRWLMAQKGYPPSELTPRHELEVRVGHRCASVRISYTVTLGHHLAMLVQFGPGSLVTRHRPTLAMARLIGSYPVPRVVVTNGEQADILDGRTGKMIASGLDQIPSRDQLMAIVDHNQWRAIDPHRKEMEARIVMAFEIDGRCPCDDSICTIKPG
jgi:hypothetical protein